MKKTLLIAPALVLSIAIFGQSDASADTVVSTLPTARVVAPANYQFKVTTIKGELTVPKEFSGSGYGNASSLANFQCSNLVVIANSKETKPRPAGYTGFWMDPPVWTRSVNATGTWASGKCNYSMSVPGGKEFNLTAGTNGDFNCSVVQVSVTNTPAWQSVPFGTTKVDNITVTKVDCIVIG